MSGSNQSDELSCILVAKAIVVDDVHDGEAVNTDHPETKITTSNASVLVTPPNARLP